MNVLKILLQAEQIREQYELFALDPKRLPISVDDYLHVISEYTEHEITLYVADWHSKRVRGMVAHYEKEGVGKGDIFIAPRKGEVAGDEEAGITLCEQRFIAIKEAGHLVIDDEDSYVKLVADLVEDLVMNTEKTLQRFDESSQSEWWAIVFAMELLFPWELREAEIAKIESGESSTYDVAKKYMIPEKQLMWIISENVHPALSEYHQDLDEINALEDDG